MTEMLKDCEEARALASRDLDGELDARGLALLEAHLASCAACQSERAALGRVDALLEDAFANHPFDERLVRDIVRMAEARSVKLAAPAQPRGQLIAFRAGGIFTAAAAAAAVVLVAVGMGVFGGTEADKQIAPAATRAVVARAHGAGLRVGNAMNEAAGEPLAVREDEVVVNNGGAGTLVLEDGTRVDLRPDTAVALHRERDGGVTVVIGPKGTANKTGAVFCEVAKQKHGRFRVMTGTVSAEVLGTKFLVRATGTESSVSVVEGRVRVVCGNQEKVLSHDQEAVAEDARPLLLARPISDQRTLFAWNKRVLDTLPAPPSAPRPPAAVNSSRPTTGPVGAPPVAPRSDLDAPVEKPDQKKK